MKNLISNLKKKEELRETLSSLRNEVKEPAKKEELLQLLEGDEVLSALLLEEDAKVRKNAALLIGDLQLQAAEEALFLAYQKETTLFVKSSYLTALGKINTRDHLDFFKERWDELMGLPVLEEEKKHRSEEIRELNRIIIKEEGLKKHTFAGFTNPHEMMLFTNREQREVTLNEVKDLSASIQRKAELHPLGVKVFSKEILPFTKLRTYRELLFPIHISGKMTQKPDAAAKQIWESDLFEFLTECHKEEAPFYFRLEVKGSEPRVDFVKKLAASIEKISEWKLLNSTTDYEMEIRLIETRDGNFIPFVKLYTLSMNRFAYRKNAIAMSINPANAAMLMHLAKPYMKEDAQILDPCCGVGTMLIERDYCVPAKEKYGIDTYGEAIEMARENATLAGEKINFIHRDYLDFKHEYKFDEIITNMPVKGRKTKEEMDAFYAAFFEKSKTLLEEDGIIIMYSNEVGFVKKQLRLQPTFRLLQEYCIRKKDNFYLFIIGIKG